MERPSFDELISAYVDDETTPEENVVVERLLADPKHRQALEEYRQLREELRSLPAPKLDADWSARLKQRLVATKPDWAEKRDGTERHTAIAPGLAPTVAETSALGGAEKPMPASLDLSRGDGYSRFRHLWLTAGVGVAAGTLGIVIGWSAQNASTGEVAQRTGAAAPITAAAPMTAASPEMSDEAAFGATVALEAEIQEPPTAGAEAEFATNGQLPDVAFNFDAAGAYAAPQADAAASMPESISGEIDAAESGRRMSRDESVQPIPGPPLIVAGAEDSEVDRYKKAGKEVDGSGGAMPPDSLAVDGAVDLSAMAQGRVLEEEILGRGIDASRYATYVGVWNRTDDDLSADRVRGVRQSNAMADGGGFGADDASARAMEESREAEGAPALVIEGSPEHVAEALEVLARDRSRGDVRLVARVDDARESSYDERSRRLSEVESRLQRQLAADAGQFRRRKEDLKEDGGRANLDAAGISAPEALAFGTARTPVERIEAFFFDDAKARSSLAQDAPSNGMLAGGFAYGSGGGGFGGGFGGIGGGAMPSAPVNDPARSDRPSINGPFAEAPPADALAELEPSAEPAAGAVPSAAQPSEPPAPMAALSQERGGASPPGPGAAPMSGPARAATEASGLVLPAPRSAPAMAEQPVPPAPAPRRADDATPAPRVEAAAAPGSAGEGEAPGKSNRFAEEAPAMPLARGVPAEGEPEADALPADEPSPPAPSRAGEAVEMAEQKLAIESLQEKRDFAAPEDRPWSEGKFLAPAPQRVRVILFASERSIPPAYGDGAPARPAARLAPATRDAPAAAKPTEGAVPAGSAPAPDR